MFGTHVMTLQVPAERAVLACAALPSKARATSQ